MTLIEAGNMLAAAGVGAREAVALGVIARMDGKAQSPDIKAALDHYSKDPMAVVAVLKNKGLVKPEDNRNGWPFWRLTPEGRRRVDAANAEPIRAGVDSACSPTSHRDSLAAMPCSALDFASRFHETYERLAPQFGYETRLDTRAFDPASKNGKLMVAACAEIFEQNASDVERREPAPLPSDG